MDMKLVEKEGKSIIIEIIDMDETLMTPLIEELLKNKKVESASYYTGHPQLDNPLLKITVKSGNPQTALKNAAERLSKLYREAYDELVMQVGE